MTGGLPAAWGAPGAFASLQARSLRSARSSSVRECHGQQENVRQGDACSECRQTADCVVAAAPSTVELGPIGAHADSF